MQLDKQLDTIPGANVNWQILKTRLNEFYWMRVHRFIELNKEQGKD
jgi:hypothetical protein